MRVILRHHGLTSGNLIIVYDTDNPRSKSAKALAYLYKLRDKESGGYLWGQSLVFLVLVTPKISIPVGVVFYQPAPELSAWYKTAGRLSRSRGSPQNSGHANRHRIRIIRPKNNLPCTCWGPSRPTIPRSGFTRSWRMRSMARRRLSRAPRPFSAVYKSSRKSAAIRTFGSRRSDQPVADYFATHPGTPYSIRIRGSEEVVAMVGSARLYVCAHKTKRFIVAIKYAEEETYRYLIASDLSWRTLDIVQGHTLRWLVEVFIQDWKSHEGWSQLTKQPGDEGARHSVLLSLLVDHSLFMHPDQQRRLKNNLPAYTVGSLRANVQVECLVEVIDSIWCRPMIRRRNSSASLMPCTRSLLFGRSKKHMIHRQLGRLSNPLLP